MIINLISPVKAGGARKERISNRREGLPILSYLSYLSNRSLKIDIYAILQK